ncbi:tyrosine-protein phosphatase [Comamonadaceae bacterium OH3737_COT-264]|nr:tyrosine-protein phosphatase [Comamonadaceae bacterium OH3737_COT-264]
MGGGWRKQLRQMLACPSSAGYEEERAFQPCRGLPCKIRPMSLQPLSSCAATATPFNRHIPFKGISNFRDLGGYRSRDGRKVRWRVLFRSDRLSDLQYEDQEPFDRLGVRHSIDFRSEAERQNSDYAIKNLQRTTLPIEPYVTQTLHRMIELGQTLDVATAHRLMAQTYEAFVQRNTKQYRAFFDVLLTQDAPVVFHCTAGKDRTGFAAAMLLEALDVPRETITRDFMLTNKHYILPSYYSANRPFSKQAMNVLWRVHRDFLNAAYQQIETSYGDVLGYLRAGLGLKAVDLGYLRAIYLEE